MASPFATSVRSPRFRRSDRCLWLWLLRVWPDRITPLMIFQPKNNLLLATRLHRPILELEILTPTWGSPRIRDELAKLGRTTLTPIIRKYCPKLPGKPSQGWKSFLQTYTGSITAMDFE